jgi:hypothetical protein
MNWGHSFGCKVLQVQDFWLQGLKARESANSIVAAKEHSEKAPPLQKAQGWVTQLQRQRVPQAATYKSAAMVAE